jgi:mycothiol synthase
MTSLPHGVRTRPLERSDAEPLHRLIAAAEEADLGAPMIELEDILGDWARPSLDLLNDSVALLEGDDLVASAEMESDRATVTIHPAHRGRGLGSWLLDWTEQKARERAWPRVGQTVVATNEQAVALLTGRGYRPLFTSWVLKLAPGDEILGDGTPPPGVQVRPLRAGEERAAYQVVEDAFNEWPDRLPTTYEDWAAPVLGRPGFEPWHLLVAADGDDVLGVCHVLVSADDSVWVNQLAVRSDQRGRGLGRVLLVAAFGEGRRRGASWAELSTDSRTGALGLYEHVGMKVTETFVRLARDLP